MITQMYVEARLIRLNAGRYELLNGLFSAERLFAVEHHADGWRWFRQNNPSVGGEWRSTKREAVLDLVEYLNTRS
jgi:hypothetical protein